MVMMVRQAVGDREVEKVNSSDENLVIVEEDEEEAYQKISDEFGVELVRIVERPTSMKFDKMIFNQINQAAEVWYQMDEESVVYIINASYKSSSLGIDMEDEVLKSEKKEVSGCEILLKEYQITNTSERRYSAQFANKGVEYLLIGIMEKDDFEKIIENLYFL